MSADFTPSLNTYTDLTPFRFWCQKVLPLVYEDSLSYYELLCKVIDYLNKTMKDVNLSIEDVEKLHTAYNSLQGYVNDYFGNLDVQEEINNKLDSLVEDGTIREIFSEDVTSILNVANQAAQTAIASIPQNVTDWLEDNITQETGYVIDDTLTVQGAAADAKKVGDELSDLKSDLNYVYTDGNTQERWTVNTGVSRQRIETVLSDTDKIIELKNENFQVCIYAYDGYTFIGNRNFETNEYVSSNVYASKLYYDRLDIEKLRLENPTYTFGVIMRELSGGSAVDCRLTNYNKIGILSLPSENPYIKTVNMFNQNDIVDGKFINSTGYHDANGYKISGAIPVIKGVRYKFPTPTGLGTNKELIYVNTDKSYPGIYETATASDGYDYFTATYTGHVVINLGTGDTSNIMFCAESVFPESYIEYGELPKSQVRLNEWQTDQLNKKQTNSLYKQIAVFDGDSICAANEGNEGKGWAGRLAELNSMTCYNAGVGGATITQGTYKNGVARHWVSAYIDTIHANYPNLNLYVFEGGTNDADLFRNTPAKLGTVDPVDFSGNYDVETFCGAFESLIYKATSYFTTAKIGYIIPPKMGPLDETTGLTGYTAETNRRRSYFEQAIMICKKWGVPYLDLWELNPMNPSLTCYYNPSVASGNFYADGQHPTAKGYDLFTPMIDSWLKAL